ncbi:MAG TPA: MaoC family dehydratase [Alphaproteobacteria bacterium]|nr:MaoC family dehydratase [Alphaproteobacteria bacterium]
MSGAKSDAAKTGGGNFFEDFRLGQEIVHATPRTVSRGDVALNTAFTGSRFALQSSDEFARRCGLAEAPLDDLLVFHIVFGKTVPDVSLNAVANLGYADCRFLAPVYPGDTLASRSSVIGLRENANRKSGIVYVRSTGRNQRGEIVLDYARWVMVRKRDEQAPAPAPHVPELPASVAADKLAVPAGLDFKGFDYALAGSRHAWEDYAPGERIDHVDGLTVEEAEHMMATKLYQNNARIHFNQHAQESDRFGRRLIYGGVIISLARALTFNGLANAVKIAAINGGRHANPTFAGATIYAWSEILERWEIPGRRDLGALRLRTVALNDHASTGFLHKTADGNYPPAVVLDLDYTVLMPRRG